MSEAKQSLVTDAIPVDLASIDSVLTKMWRRENVASESSAGVLTRACMSNLIIVCRGPDQARKVTAEVDTIVAKHPSRVLLLIADAYGPLQDGPIAAEVSAHCHIGGQNRQICSEMVAIKAGRDTLDRLPSAVRSLLIGDLPTSLWWASETPPSLAGALFEELSAMVDQVIYSSLNWNRPIEATISVAGWEAALPPGDLVAVDLAWSELIPWRRLIAHSLDPSIHPGALEGIDVAEIECGSRRLPQAWLLLGWLASSLRWGKPESTRSQGAEWGWRCLSPRGAIEIRVHEEEKSHDLLGRVNLRSKIADKELSLSIAPAGPKRLCASTKGVETEDQTLAGLPDSQALLVATELEELVPHRWFRESLAVSARFAETVERR